MIIFDPENTIHKKAYSEMLPVLRTSLYAHAPGLYTWYSPSELDDIFWRFVDEYNSLEQPIHPRILGRRVYITYCKYTKPIDEYYFYLILNLSLIFYFACADIFGSGHVNDIEYTTKLMEDIIEKYASGNIDIGDGLIQEVDEHVARLETLGTRVQNQSGCAT